MCIYWITIILLLYQLKKSLTVINQLNEFNSFPECDRATHTDEVANCKLCTASDATTITACTTCMDGYGKFAGSPDVCVGKYNEICVHICSLVSPMMCVCQ